MKKIFDLKNGGIKETINRYNKRLIISYSLIIVAVIGILGFTAYECYLNDPYFEIRSTLSSGIIIIPLILFALVSIIKNIRYSKDFKKNPAYLRLKKRFKFNNMNDFENFNREVTSQAINNALFDDERSQIMGTNSYIIKYKLPANKNFDVYDPSKLLLVVFKPLRARDLVLKSRRYCNRCNTITLYFEDEAVVFAAASKKRGEELSRNIAKEYKVLKGTNAELENFYFKDREKFVKICREQIQKVYSETEKYQ